MCLFTVDGNVKFTIVTLVSRTGRDPSMSSSIVYLMVGRLL